MQSQVSGVNHDRTETERNDSDLVQLNSSDALEELANAIRARRWAKLLALADRHRLEQEGSK